MSKIDKMNILGIRSFPAQHGETIIFFTPLTLICGANGSGKTTIVECLKYATSGIQPPNSKVGGAFIHDPKLTGEKEVMASVKMQFRSTQNARMVVTRSLQLTVKKTARSLKTLEGSLLIERNGEKTTVSSRVAELDTQVPYNLGVSPAVLDNVIFCHQDESLWPLSEPSTLKKKFDEIFEAQKYTKAVDNIKQIRKKHNEELGKYKILEQHAKEDRDRAERAKKKSEELSNSIEALRVQCTDLQSKMDGAQARADSLWKDSEEYSRILGMLEGKQIEARATRSNISMLRARLEEVPQSDEWLERNLTEFDTAIAQCKSEQQSKKEEWLEWKDEIKTLNDHLSGKLAEKGKHEQDKEEHARHLSRRHNMIADAANRHQLRGFEDPTVDGVAESFMRKIQKLFKEHTASFEKARASADEEKQKSLTLINRLTERKAALQDSKGSARDQIARNDREASDYQRKVDAIKVDEGTKAAIEARIDDLTARLHTAHEATQTSDWDTKLREANSQLRSQEDEYTRLNASLVQATKRAGDMARLAHLKQEVKEKQRSLDTLLTAHTKRIKELIGPDWNSLSLEQVHGAALEEASQAIKDAENIRNITSREVEQAQFKQKTVRSEISRKKTQAIHDEKAVTRVIDTAIDGYETVLEQATEHVTRARDQAKGTEGLLDYFTKCLENFDASKPSCRLCHRGFKNADDPNLVTARKRMIALIDKASKKIGEAEIAQAEAAYQAIVNAGIPFADWKKITGTEIPSLETALAELDQGLVSLLGRLEDQDKVVQQKQAARRELETLSRTVSSVAKHANDIANYQLQIEELTAEQSQQGRSQTLDDIQDQISVVNETIRSIKKTIDSITTDQTAAKTQLHEWELKMRDLKNELSASTSLLDKKEGLISRVAEFMELNKKHYTAIEKADKDVEQLDPQISAAKAEADDMQQRWATKLGDLGREASQLGDTFNEIKLINDQINSYVDRKVEQRLSTIIKEIRGIEESIQNADSCQVQLTRELSKIEDTLRDQDLTKKKYHDNLSYRAATRALERLEEEVSDLVSRNAHIDRDRFQQESKQATREYQNYSGQREGLLGQMKTRDNQLGELLKDYETDLKDAPRRYKEAHIKVETTKAAVSDLQVYGSALDNAIMKFHGLKMEQVNDIIKHLWQKTYKGSDVDNIMIRSDNEAGVTTARGRSYNYRVVMVKQGVEMDMRGRCSAGQKVLASIIIRLALADVFSQDCGLIALDEPTTNLDYDNIISLAHSLHDIIEERRKQSNFQLIVITHDEEFLRAINPAAFCDHYWRVSRDRNADSVIEKQKISEV